MFHYPLGEGPLFLPDGAFEDYYRSLKAVADECGLKIGQVHSPFPTYLNDKDDELRLEAQHRSVRACALLGCRYMVMHPAIPGYRLYDQGVEECKALNMQRYEAVIPDLEKYDVSIAVENMFSYDRTIGRHCPTVCSTAEEMADYIDTLNRLSPHFVACLDVGHALITGDTPDHMARILGDRLKVLHVQDNDGNGDWHVIPHMGKVDWPAFTKALREIGYKGTFSLEADNFPRLFGLDHADTVYPLMLSVAKKLAEKVG